MTTVVAVVIAGCGGGEGGATADQAKPSWFDVPKPSREPSGPTGPSGSAGVLPLNKAEYLERASHTCEESLERMRRSFAIYKRNEGRGKSKEKQFADASQSIFLPAIQFWFDDISYLPVPKGELHQVIPMLKTMQRAVYAGEKQTLSSAQQLSDIFAPFSKMAHEYGLEACVVAPTFP